MTLENLFIGWLSSVKNFIKTRLLEVMNLNNDSLFSPVGSIKYVIFIIIIIIKTEQDVGKGRRWRR